MNMVGKIVLPRSSRKRLLSSLLCNHASASNSGENFKLKSSQEFASRSKNVFEELNTLEKEHESWISHHETINDDEINSHGSSEVASDELKKKLIPKELSSDGFKKPFIPAPRRRKFPRATPEFKKNPQKWTMYTLTDTPILSDECNTAAAMQFLEEMRKRREETPVSVQEDMLLFHKPEETCTSTGKSSLVPFVKCSPFVRGTQNVMRECVVGKKLMKKVKVKKQKATTNTNIKLDHLDDLLS